MIGWNLQVSNNRKVVRNQIRGRNRENVAPRKANHKVERMIMNVGRKVKVLYTMQQGGMPERGEINLLNFPAMFTRLPSPNANEGKSRPY